MNITEFVKTFTFLSEDKRNAFWALKGPIEQSIKRYFPDASVRLNSFKSFEVVQEMVQHTACGFTFKFWLEFETDRNYTLQYAFDMTSSYMKMVDLMVVEMAKFMDNINGLVVELQDKGYGSVRI